MKDGNFKTLKEFIQSQRKRNQGEKKELVNWEERKNLWRESINILYNQVDEIIVNPFKDEQYTVQNRKVKTRIIEEHVGEYEVDSYVIQIGNKIIRFQPIGTIIIGAYGRVDMFLPRETFKLVLVDWRDWKIVLGFGGDSKLVEFNEENIVKLFEENF